MGAVLGDGVGLAKVVVEPALPGGAGVPEAAGSPRRFRSIPGDLPGQRLVGGDDRLVGAEVSGRGPRRRWARAAGARPSCSSGASRPAGRRLHPDDARHQAVRLLVGQVVEDLSLRVLREGSAPGRGWRGRCPSARRPGRGSRARSPPRGGGRGDRRGGWTAGAGRPGTSASAATRAFPAARPPPTAAPTSIGALASGVAGLLARLAPEQRRQQHDGEQQRVSDEHADSSRLAATRQGRRRALSPSSPRGSPPRRPGPSPSGPR